MLFPAHGGNRIALKYPTIVPAWWFGLFPDPIHVVTSSATLALSPDVPSGATAPSPADTRVSADNDLPPGRYVATFSWSCAPTENAGGAENGSLTDLVLTIESGRGSRRSRIVEEPVPAAPCTSAPRSITVGPFGSDGYDSITFHIVHSTGVTLGAPKVTYRPA
jgi:hypothetical protein